ncbi:MAG: CHAT domain-containing protein [bacterium]|nr:CHAT domain-containing protein [bacterium]
MQYRDFSIKIEPPSGGEYPVNVLSSPAGQDRGSFRIPFEPGEFAALLDGLGQAVRGDAISDLRDLPTAGAKRRSAPSPRTVGDHLFRALFKDQVLSLLDHSLGTIDGDPNQGLRLRLHFDPEHPDLSRLCSLPWELLYRHPHRAFLSLSRTSPVVRCLDVPRGIRPVLPGPPLRILVVVSRPAGLAVLDLDRERRHLEEVWGKLAGVEIVTLPRATPEALRTALLERPFQVLHFMGHGGFDRATGDEVLFFEDDDGRAQPVPGQVLGDVLRDASSLGLAFLNACDTARSRHRDGLDPFTGVAAALVMARLPAVVAMQFPISDHAAIAFSNAFYRRLAAGDSVDAAAVEGRMAIHLRDTRSMEWSTPVLFMRTGEERLFSELGTGTSRVLRDRSAGESSAAMEDLERLIERAQWTDAIRPMRLGQVVRRGGRLTRDLGAAPLPPDATLRLGDWVCLGIRSERPGHLLLIDVGSSGTVFCLCPSHFAPDTRLPAGESIFPQQGSPWEAFQVSGPAGRERLLAIISDAPLDLDWRSSNPRQPARRLTDNDVGTLLARLRALDRNCWTALATELVVAA